MLGYNAATKKVKEPPMQYSGELIRALQAVVGTRGVVMGDAALMTYEADGCVMDLHAPNIVVLPQTSEQTAAIVKIAHQARIPVVARGAGTGLSGGATPIHGGIVIAMTRMDQVLEVDAANRRVRVQPGVINWELSQQLAPYGYAFMPDPSSQKACTLGGNIANNSGGPHCLKYGMTTNHILALRTVLPNGDLIWTGNGRIDTVGYDLAGVMTGSEGMFGVVTEAWVRMTRLPEALRVVLALFPDIPSASQTVSTIIARGILPAALEMMDKLAIKAVNGMYKLGLPDSAGSALLIEVDGVSDGLDELLAQVVGICREHGAIEVRPATTAAEQAQVWAARKNAFGALRSQKLKKLVADHLGAEIQVAGAAHDPAEDARAALAVYKLFRTQWERDEADRSRRHKNRGGKKKAPRAAGGGEKYHASSERARKTSVSGTTTPPRSGAPAGVRAQRRR